MIVAEAVIYALHMKRLSMYPTFQREVAYWVEECFGIKVANDTLERNFRFLEESLELVQSLGCTKAEALRLVDYVYGRPDGDPKQEVGGVMITLMALCSANKMNAEQLGLWELQRIWEKMPEIRAKQIAKRRLMATSDAEVKPPGFTADGEGQS